MGWCPGDLIPVCFTFYFRINEFSHTAWPLWSCFRSLGPGFRAVGTERGAGPASRGQASALCGASEPLSAPSGVRDLGLSPACCLVKPGGSRGDYQGALKDRPALMADRLRSLM